MVEYGAVAFYIYALFGSVSIGYLFLRFSYPEIRHGTQNEKMGAAAVAGFAMLFPALLGDYLLDPPGFLEGSGIFPVLAMIAFLAGFVVIRTYLATRGQKFLVVGIPVPSTMDLDEDRFSRKIGTGKMQEFTPPREQPSLAASAKGTPAGSSAAVQGIFASKAPTSSVASKPPTPPAQTQKPISSTPIAQTSLGSGETKIPDTIIIEPMSSKAKPFQKPQEKQAQTAADLLDDILATQKEKGIAAGTHSEHEDEFLSLEDRALPTSAAKKPARQELLHGQEKEPLLNPGTTPEAVIAPVGEQAKKKEMPPWAGLGVAGAGAAAGAALLGRKPEQQPAVTNQAQQQPSKSSASSQDVSSTWQAKSQAGKEQPTVPWLTREARKDDSRPESAPAQQQQAPKAPSRQEAASKQAPSSQTSFTESKSRHDEEVRSLKEHLLGIHHEPEQKQEAPKPAIPGNDAPSTAKPSAPSPSQEQKPSPSLPPWQPAKTDNSNAASQKPTPPARPNATSKSDSYSQSSIGAANSSAPAQKTSSEASGYGKPIASLGIPKKLPQQPGLKPSDLALKEASQPIKPFDNTPKPAGALSPLPKNAAVIKDVSSALDAKASAQEQADKEKKQESVGFNFASLLGRKKEAQPAKAVQEAVGGKTGKDAPIPVMTIDDSQWKKQQEKKPESKAGVELNIPRKELTRDEKAREPVDDSREAEMMMTDIMGPIHQADEELEPGKIVHRRYLLKPAPGAAKTGRRESVNVFAHEDVAQEENFEALVTDVYSQLKSTKGEETSGLGRHLDIKVPPKNRREEREARRQELQREQKQASSPAPSAKPALSFDDLLGKPAPAAEKPAGQAGSTTSLGMASPPSAQPTPGTPAPSASNSLFSQLEGIASGGGSKPTPAPAQKAASPKSNIEFVKVQAEPGMGCPTCKSRNSRIIFCPYCGTGMCANCSPKIVPAADHFAYTCPKCGEEVEVKKKMAKGL